MTDKIALAETLAEHELSTYSGGGTDAPFARCTCDNNFEYVWSNREREHADHLHGVTLNWSDTRVREAKADALRSARDEIAQMLTRFPKGGRHTRASWSVGWLDLMIDREAGDQS